MKEKTSLSDEIDSGYDFGHGDWLTPDSVKKAIKRLKKGVGEFTINGKEFKEKIDKIFGEKLI